MTFDDFLMLICFTSPIRGLKKHLRLLEVGCIKLLTPSSHHDYLETMNFEYILLEKTFLSGSRVFIYLQAKEQNICSESTLLLLVTPLVFSPITKNTKSHA